MNAIGLTIDSVSASHAVNSFGSLYAEDCISWRCCGCSTARCPGPSETGGREAVGTPFDHNARLGARLSLRRKANPLCQNDKARGPLRFPSRRKVSHISEAVGAATAHLARELPQESYLVHKVKGGETLHSIARKYRVPVGDLARVNNITDMDNICYDDCLQVPGRPSWVGSIRVAEVTPGVEVVVRTADSEPVPGSTLPRKKRGRAKPEVSASVGGVFLHQSDPLGVVHGLEIAAAVGLLVTSLVCGMMLSFIWHTWTKAKSAQAAQSARVVRKKFGRAQLRQRVEGALSGEAVMDVKTIVPGVLPQEPVAAFASALPSTALDEGFATVLSNEEQVIEDDGDDMVRVDRPYGDILKSYDQMQDEYNKFLRDARVGKKGIMGSNVPREVR